MTEEINFCVNVSSQGKDLSNIRQTLSFFPIFVSAATLAVSIVCVIIANTKLTEWEKNNSYYELISAVDNINDAEPVTVFEIKGFSMSKASAHKSLTVTTLKNIEGEPVFFEDKNMDLEFDIAKNDSSREYVRNVKLLQTAMVVQHTGMYFIYSSVFFKADSAKPCKSFKKQIWEHNIVLTRDNDSKYRRIIFTNSYKCCDECTGSKETSYTSGTLLLQENDRLHVEVSSDGVVHFNKEGSYFGLYMLN